MQQHVSDEEVATEAETRAALLERAKRTSTPLRRSFVQTPRELVGEDDKNMAGPLAWFVKTKNHRALLAYLLVVAATSNGDGPNGWSTTHSIRVWARAFDTTKSATGTSASTAVSKIFQKLVDRTLVERHRTGRQRKIRVTLKREDGKGADYTRPDGKTPSDRFLQLPHAFWFDGWHEKLTLPALAMLLVALREKPGFELPTEKVPDWYGWSADTAERGLDELVKHGLLAKSKFRRKAPLEDLGFTYVNRYFLQPPFGAGISDKSAADDAANTEVVDAMLNGPQA